MSDAFDPDAWPYPQGGRPKQGSGTARRNDDDYDDLSFDDQDFAPDNYEDDDVDASTTGRQPAPGYDDYAYEDEPTASRSARAGRADDDFEDDYDNGRGYADTYDDEYDDEYDDDDYDREVSGGGGKGRKIIGVLAAFALLGALVVGAMTLFGGNEPDPVAQPSPDQNVPADPVDPAIEGTPAEAPPEVIEAIEMGLEAWGEFAVNGNLEAVRPFFINEGKQFGTFEAEAPELQRQPPGGEPMSVTMEPEVTTLTQNGDWLVKGIVTWARPGAPPMEYPWEIHVSRPAEADPWQILKVRQY